MGKPNAMSNIQMSLARATPFSVGRRLPCLRMPSVPRRHLVQGALLAGGRRREWARPTRGDRHLPRGRLRTESCAAVLGFVVIRSVDSDWFAPTVWLSVRASRLAWLGRDSGIVRCQQNSPACWRDPACRQLPVGSARSAGQAAACSHGAVRRGGRAQPRWSRPPVWGWCWGHRLRCAHWTRAQRAPGWAVALGGWRPWTGWRLALGKPSGAVEL